MEDFDPLTDVKPLSRSDIHCTDVLMRFSEARGASYYSVIEEADDRGLVLVQNQNGSQFRAAPSTFIKRYSLSASGKFNLTWRISPIDAVAQHKQNRS